MNNKLHHDTVNWVAVELQTTGEWFRVNFQYHGAIYHQWEDRCIKDWRQFVFYNNMTPKWSNASNK